MAKLEVGVTDLQTLAPEIAKEWHPTLNGNLKPSNVHKGSSKLVWWLCPNGHSYQKTVSKRTIRGQKCPQCRMDKNSFANVHPELLDLWDYEKNKEISPQNVSYGSEKKVWWKCIEGHSYQQAVHAKSGGYGCPICAHQQISEENCLANVNPEIAKEWHPTKNGKLTPFDVMPSAHKKIWWLCPFGHEYRTVIYARRRTGCPICNTEKRTSFPEQAIQFYLGKQLLVENRCDIGGFEADIYCPTLKMAIEYDGEYFHSGRQSDAREKRKNEHCMKNGIILIRVKETKKTVELKCHHTDYGYEIYTTYSQEYDFIEGVIDNIINIINNEFHLDYSVDVAINRDKVAIINMYAQQKDENSFLRKKPLGAQKWDYKKNGDIDLRLLPRTSKKKYWWKCPTCKNEWFGTLDGIVNSLTCNKCARQVKSDYDIAPEIMMGKDIIFKELDVCLQSQNPELAAQWHPTKNGCLKPIHVSPKSGKRVWWLCPECGNEWIQIIKTRNNGIGARKCPVCANNQKKKAEVISPFLDILYKEWHHTKNGDKVLNDYTPGSTVKVWWKCSRCNNDYFCSIKARKNGGGCAVCGLENASKAKYKRIINLDTKEIFDSVKSAAQKYGISSNNITNCLTGRTKSAGGYRWKYYNKQNDRSSIS